MQKTLCAAVGAAGGVIAGLLGGWDAAIATLIICMAVDFVTGLLVAGVFHASKKTQTGALESGAGFKGLCRKCVTLLMVLIAARMDILLGVRYIRDAAVIGFCANEIISIAENAGLMGLPLPAAVTGAVDILRRKAEREEKTNE